MEKSAKARTRTIDILIKKYKPNEEYNRWLSNGFVPEEIKEEYETILQEEIKKVTESDTDLDKSLYSNFFYLHPEKIVGKEVPGSGFINPVNTVGSIDQLNDAIPYTLPTNEKMAKKSKPSEVKTEPTNIDTLKAAAKESPNIHFVTPTPDTEPKQERTSKKPTPIKQGMAVQRLKQEREEQKTATPQPELLSIEGSLKKYNPGISEAEIKGWVYYKRSYGNPMRGWEKFFLKESKTKETLVYAKVAFYLKDQQFRDVKLVPTGTPLGKMTKFKNEYDSNTYVVIKNEANELYYVNDKNIETKVIGNEAAHEELIELVKQRGLCWADGTFIPIPLYAYGNIYDIKEVLIGKFDRETNKIAGGYFQKIVEMFDKETADWHLSLVEEAIRLKGEYYFDDPTPSRRPFLASENPISHDFKVKRLNDESGVDFEKIFEATKTRRNRYEHYDEDTSYSLFQAFEQWFSANINDTMLQRTTKRNVIDYYILGRNFMKGSEMTDKEKDEIKLNARIEGEKFYADFLATALTSNDIKGLNIVFNRTYNSISKINLDKVPVGFEVNAKIFNTNLHLNNAQRNGIAFMAANNSGCLAYDVGFGKTLTAIHNLAALLKQGAIKRPLIVVPKPVYNNWIREMFGFWTDGQEKRLEQFEGARYVNGALTGTQYKLNTWFNLSKKIEFQNAMVDPDTITLMTYEGFYRMGFSEALQDELFEGLYSILESGKTDTSKATVREATKKKEGVKKMMGIGIKETVIDIDVCGFDYLVFDEAHAFKNVFNGVPLDEDQNNVWRLPQKGTHTARAVKAFFSSLYMQKRFGGNVQLLTATPFTNSPLEIFSMLSLVGYETLKKYNLQNLYEFLGLFIETEVEYAVNAMNEIVLNTVIKSFKNKNLLRDILYRHFDYQDDPELAGVKRPCKLNFPNSKVSTYLEQSVKQSEAQMIVKEQAASYDRRTNPGAMGRALNWAKNNAFSPYLVPGIDTYENLDELVEDSPKLNFTIQCIKTVKEWHESRGQEMSGQVIYSNRGVALFQDFKKALEDICGFKRKVQFGDNQVDEVEIILGGGTDADIERKEIIKDAFNKGYCKIVIGTSTIKEGVNLQELGTVEYNLDLDWNPTDFKQLEGRIWRQGNQFKYVRIVVPMVQNTLDSFINQKLDEKSKRISSLWDKTNSSNSLEEFAAVDPMEIKFALIDDPNELLKMKVDKDKSTAAKNATIAQEKYEAINKISVVINEFNEVYDKLKSEIEATYKNHKAYMGYLEKFAKQKDIAQTQLTSIKELQEKLNENILLFEDYTVNGNFRALFDVFRFINARAYTFKKGSDSYGNFDYGDMVEKYTGESYYGSFETWSSWDTKKMIASYGDMKKLERLVLQPYGLTVDDNYDGIKKKFKTEHETYKNELDYLSSIEYKEKALEEIVHELKRRANERGTIEQRVAEFADYNYLLSFPFSKETANQCELPADIEEYTGDTKIVGKELEKEYEEVAYIGGKNIKKNKANKPEEDSEKTISFSKEALVFVPKMQVRAATSFEYNEAKERINEIVSRIPNYDKSKGNKALLHYFKGGSDYFVIEKDFSEGYKNVYGYAILNQDWQNAEFGSQSLDELKNHMELDFYFTPKPLSEALKGVGYPGADKFKQYEKEYTPETSGPATTEAEPTMADYQASLEGAEIAMEFAEGDEKTELQDYIDGLRVAIEFMEPVEI